MPGSIILLHDKPGKATECMLEALPGIIDDLKCRGFEFVLAFAERPREIVATTVARTDGAVAQTRVPRVLKACGSKNAARKRSQND